MTEQYLKAFAEPLFIQKELYDSVEQHEQKVLKHTMMYEIRLFADATTPYKSENAQKLFPNVDLSTISWLKQPSIDPNRKLLVYEHKDTVKEIWNRVMKSTSVEEIVNILSSTKLVWITREEDKKLRQNGFNSKRPNSDEAYRICGIKIL